MIPQLAEIDRQIAEKHLLKHPFYQAWTRGDLSQAALQDYARQYYHHVVAFPTYLSAVHSNTDDQRTRRELLKNLTDEEAGEVNHPELWLRFAEAIGVPRAEVQSIPSTGVWPETRVLVNTFRDICRNGSTAQGLAALYAYESQIPAVAESKIDGLQKYYGLKGSSGLAYFQIHIEADKEHAAAERALLAEQLDGQNAKTVDASVNSALGALWGMLDGVCRRHEIEC